MSAVITELVGLLQDQKRITHSDAVLQAIQARERIRSTAVGEGLAVPHAKCEGVPRLAMAVGKPGRPLNIDSPDGRPGQMIVLIAGPKEGAGQHLQALAAISRLWLSPAFREAALAATTADELYAAFERYQA